MSVELIKELARYGVSEREYMFVVTMRLDTKDSTFCQPVAPLSMYEIDPRHGRIVR